MSFLALVNAYTAGVVIFAHSSLTKMMMTLEFRERMTRPGNEELAKKIAGSESFKVTASTQVNEAEYAGLMCAALFYLATQGATETSVGASKGTFTLKETLNDVNFVFNEEGMKVMAMDGSHVALISLKLFADRFENYY